MPKYEKAELDQVVKLRKEGRRWVEIAEALGKTEGVCIQLWDINEAAVNAKKAGGRKLILEPTPKDIVKLRNENLSWGKIVALTGGIPESKVRALAEQGGLDPKGHRIGRGGRRPGSTNGDGAPARAAGTTKKASKAVAKAAATPGLPANWEKLTDEQLVEKLPGKTLLVQRGDKSFELHVGEVTKVAKGNIHLKTVDGKGRVAARSAVIGLRKTPASVAA